MVLFYRTWEELNKKAMQQFLHRGSPIELDASHYNGFFMYWVGWLKISLSLNPNTKRSKYNSLWNEVVPNNSGYTDHSHHFAFDFLMVKSCPWTKLKCGFRFYVECRIGIYSLFLFRDNCWSKEIQKQNVGNVLIPQVIRYLSPLFSSCQNVLITTWKATERFFTSSWDFLQRARKKAWFIAKRSISNEICST